MTSGPYPVLLEALGAAPAGVGTAELDRRPEPWESSMQATCECLSWRGTLGNLERRHAEDDLGETAYRSVPDHVKSAVVTAHELMDRGAFTPDELRVRMDAIRARLRRG